MHKDRSPRSEPARERRIFPVTDRGVQQTLAEIRRNPLIAYRRETNLMRSANGDLHGRVRQAEQSLTNNDEVVNFTKGATWAYGMLRIDGELKGTQLPKLPADLISVALFEDGIELLPGSSENIARLKGKWEEIAHGERALRQGFAEITKYDPYADAVLAGAGFVVRLFKKYEDSEELRRRFGF
ncbi:MAG TPA: hypothetical protein VLF20_00265 [Patescibacteria group bacterium]|nr:hypothetical protein [Patescibacteria group bacterium]